MKSTVSIEIERQVCERLEKLAIIAGNKSSAIERLINYWESTQTEKPTSAVLKDKKPKYWYSSSDDKLPIGTELLGSDDGKEHQAIVEENGIRYDGKLYDSPSSAARAVKNKRGLHGPSASTNGREFWKLRNPENNRWVSIKSYALSNR